MVKKTIPQLQEATDITDNAYLVVDTGSVTKKISKGNLQKTFKQKQRTITLTSQTISKDDDTIFMDSPDSPMGMDVNLPPAAECDGKVLRIKNINTGMCGIYGNDYGVEKIEGQNEYDLSGLNKAVTLVCDGSNWFIFA